MGLCVSHHKDKPESTMMKSVGSEILIPSPVKQKPVTVNGADRTVADVTLNSPASFGDSKDEAFFDSQPWIESDCEDDFFSVNGDFTPSRGSTPSRHSFSSGNLLMINKPVPVVEVTVNPVPEAPSPSNKKKRLSDLFKESLRSNEHLDELYKAAQTNTTAAKTKAEEQPTSRNSTPYFSNEIAPNGVMQTEGRSNKAAQCCIPRSLLYRGSGERKKGMSLVNGVA